jgi:hypothetical protein
VGWPGGPGLKLDALPCAALPLVLGRGMALGTPAGKNVAQTQTQPLYAEAGRSLAAPSLEAPHPLRTLSTSVHPGLLSSMPHVPWTWLLGGLRGPWPSQAPKLSPQPSLNPTGLSGGRDSVTQLQPGGHRCDVIFPLWTPAVQRSLLTSRSPVPQPHLPPVSSCWGVGSWI